MAPTSDTPASSSPTHDPEELAPSVWRILARNFGEAIDLLRNEDSLRGLENSPWWVLVWVAHSWTCGDKSPSQADLARRAGLSIRTVRRGLRTLEELDLLRVARDKGVTTELDVGPRFAPLLRDFAFCRDPKIWNWTPRVGPRPLAGVATTPDNGTHVPRGTPDNGTHVPRGTPDNGTHVPRGTPDNGTYVRGRSRHDEPRAPALLGAVVPHGFKGFRTEDAPRSAPAVTDGRGARPASVPPEAPPSFINKKEEDLDSLSSERGPTPATQPDPNPGQPVDAPTARRLALDALATWFRRAHVGIPLPRTCDAADVRLVEACTANGDWHADTLRQAHLDAIDGAFEKASPDRPPTPRYIWGQLRFFLAHASVGRAKRLRAEAPPKPKKVKPPEDPPASPEWLAQHMREAAAKLEGLPSLSTPKRPLRFGGDTE